MPVWLDDAEAGRGGLATVRRFLANAWEIDRIFRETIVATVVEGARALWAIVDFAFLDRGIVDGAKRLAEGLGRLLAELQNGRVIRYAAYVAVGVIALLAAAVF
jgi:NADH:ubiquinone oxidoreductase subunit 5 (subunit L)/multisubunit Na+/H+ antiporter MnhA subunit